MKASPVPVLKLISAWGRRRPRGRRESRGGVEVGPVLINFFFFNCSKKEQTLDKCSKYIYKHFT